MAGLTCPNCNAVASTAEIASGWCDSCGKKIPFSYTAAATSPKRTARDALMAQQTLKATRRSNKFIGTLLGGALGILVSAIVMVGLLRNAGYILILFVVFAIMLAGLSLGQIVDGMLVKERK
jgi:hypothetical protein